MSGIRDWYPQYPADFLTDPAVELMSLEQEGAYRRLLDYAWREGGLPPERALLARLVRVPVAHFEENIWPAITGCWVERRGRLVNRRQEKERKKAKHNQRERRAAAKKRWEQAKQQQEDTAKQKHSKSRSKSNAHTIPNHTIIDGGDVDDPEGSKTSPPSVDTSTSVCEGDEQKRSSPWPPELARVEQVLVEYTLQGSELDNPTWWKTQLEWVKSEGVDVRVLTEFKRYMAWLESQSRSRQHKNRKRGFRNWLAKEVERRTYRRQRDHQEREHGSQGGAIQ